MNTPRNQEPSANPFERYSIANNTKLSIYLADRDHEGALVPLEKMNISSNRYIKALSLMFGGCSIINTKGAYLNDNNKIIYENTDIIYSYCIYDDLLKYKDELILLLEETATFTSQECILFTIDDKPYYIYNRDIILNKVEKEEEPQKEEEEEEKKEEEPQKEEEEEEKKEEEPQKEKEIITDLSFKTFYNYDNMIKYINNHLVYSTLNILEHGGDHMKYTEGEQLKINDLIFIFDKYSSYSYDCIYIVTGITKCFIKYKRIIYNSILEYMNNKNYGQSKQVYKYNYNNTHEKEYRKKINNMYLKLSDNFKNADFLYITRFLH
jgi:hypothetical protein